ncbi:MAG: hypothetical protein CSA20_07100 [Deltaproteobacteria bacterium]|nr:MAG: hypothetical protein CSA20_07100 [Deltaproteobacteria bacterium]
MIDPELLPEFIVEAGEHLDEMEANLIKLEADPDNREIINEIFRDVHTIKGSSAYLGLKVTSELAHKLENLLEIVRQGELAVDSSLIDILINARDRMVSLVTDVEDQQRELTEIEDIVATIQNYPNESEKDRSKAEKASQPASPDQGVANVEQAVQGAFHEMDTDRGAGTGSEDFSPQGTAPDGLQGLMRSFSEDEINLNLDDFFSGEDIQSSTSSDTTGLQPEHLKDQAPPEAGTLAKEPAVKGQDDDVTEIKETFEEGGDEELFSIFLEHLNRELHDIWELAVQISSAENRSGLLGAIKERIDNLKSSAMYMGYDSLGVFYDSWQEKLGSYQDSPLLSESLSSETIIEEGITFYFDIIKAKLPQLQEKEQVQEADEKIDSISSPQLSGTGSEAAADGEVNAENEYEEQLDTELFAVFLDQLKDNLHQIHTLSRQVSAEGDPFEFINTIKEKVTRIRAAANYMGYGKLTGIYDEWAGKIDLLSYPETVFANGADRISEIKHCIKAYTDQLLEIFPQLQETDSAAGTDPEIVPDKQRISIPVSPPDSAESQGSTASSLPADRMSELLSSDDEVEEDESTLYDLSEVSEDGGGEEDQVLADRLSAALDDALGMRDGVVSDKEPEETGGSSIEAAPEHIEPDLQPSSPAAQEISKKNELHASLPETAENNQDGKRSSAAEDEEIFFSIAEKLEVAKEGQGQENTGSSPEIADKVLRQSLRIDANKIDELMNQAGELVINRAWFSQLYNEMRRLELQLQNSPGLNKRDFKEVKGFSFKLHEAITALGRVANDLQESVMKVRMLPISQLFNRYPRLIRDLVHDSDKDVRLALRGADTELDKMIIEEIADPLIHVIRNAVDHGIEPEATRKELGKPEQGRLQLNAYHEGSHVVIEVTDDGRGIDPEAIKAIALQKQIVTGEQAARMSVKEINELIMRPGFSTADQVTRTSGRGVGMDVVKKNLESLNGTIEIESQPGEGTCFRMKIPLTLAVIKALLVKVDGVLFTIPLITVDETLRVRGKDIDSIKGNEVVYLRDSTIPLIRLARIFNFSDRSGQLGQQEKTFVVIVSMGSNRVGLVVDELRGQEEVVIKPLPDYLRNNKGFSGATILGDGRISLILDINELIKLTLDRQNRKVNDLITDNAL